jgi:hypothetical protein
MSLTGKVSDAFIKKFGYETLDLKVLRHRHATSDSPFDQPNASKSIAFVSGPQKKTAQLHAFKQSLQ